jgi:hypothetical protein
VHDRRRGEEPALVVHSRDDKVRSLLFRSAEVGELVPDDERPSHRVDGASAQDDVASDVAVAGDDGHVGRGAPVGRNYLPDDRPPYGLRRCGDQLPSRSVV